MGVCELMYWEEGRLHLPLSLLQSTVRLHKQPFKNLMFVSIMCLDKRTNMLDFIQACFLFNFPKYLFPKEPFWRVNSASPIFFLSVFVSVYYNTLFVRSDNVFIFDFFRNRYIIKQTYKDYHSSQMYIILLNGLMQEIQGFFFVIFVVYQCEYQYRLPNSNGIFWENKEWEESPLTNQVCSGQWWAISNTI